jgi:hypothetical protein
MACTAEESLLIGSNHTRGSEEGVPVQGSNGKRLPLQDVPEA